VSAPARLFWFAEPVACSDPAAPIGRLLLADDGLTFIPGKRSRAAARADQGWLAHALSDDEGLEDLFAAVAHRAPAEQRAAIAGSLHLAAPSGLALAGRTLAVSEPARSFTLPPVLGASLRAWLAAIAAVAPDPRM
jgi:hypothetical protein